MIQKRGLPSDHEKARTALEEAAQTRDEEKRRQEAIVLNAFDWLLRQENGRVVWAWFFNRCGYNKPTLMRTSAGEIAQLTTECLSAQRQIYLEARKLVSSDILVDAEYEAEFGPRAKLDDKGDKKNA